MRNWLKLNLIVVFILSCSKIYGQQNFSNYSFKVENHPKIGFDTLQYEGMMNEFSYSRLFLNDSEFVEMHFLGKSDTFRITANGWEIKQLAKWTTFHSNVGKFYQFEKWGEVYKTLIGRYYYKGVAIYKYAISLKSQLDLKTEFPVIMYFNNIDGIYKIQYNSFSLIRQPNIFNSCK